MEVLEVQQSSFLGPLNPGTFSMNRLILCRGRVLLALQKLSWTFLFLLKCLIVLTSSKPLYQYKRASESGQAINLAKKVWLLVKFRKIGSRLLLSISGG